MVRRIFTALMPDARREIGREAIHRLSVHLQSRPKPSKLRCQSLGCAVTLRVAHASSLVRHASLGCDASATWAVQGVRIA
jgi:hypothetical protein